MQIDGNTWAERTSAANAGRTPWLARWNFTVDTGPEPRPSEAAVDYFARAGLRVNEVKGGSIRARVAAYHWLTLVHSTVPLASLTWVRDETTVPTATLIYVLGGKLEVRSSERLISRGPDITLIPPGLCDVDLISTAERTELIYLSLHATYFADLLPSGDPQPPRRIVEPATMSPLLSFIASTCAIVNPWPEIAQSMEPVAHETARSLLLATFGAPAPQGPLYSRAHECILNQFTDPGLRLDDVARELGVSPRTLQLELQEGGTSFRQLLLHARTVAALDLLRSDPGIQRVTVAARCGFGSLSSLNRALRASDQLRPQPES